jgi:hypothetical protein
VLPIAPDALRGVLRKEGALEWMSHALLVVDVLVFALASYRHRSAAVAALAGFTMLVLAEELDWGAELGVRGIERPLRALSGDGNLHNRWSGHSYLLFAAPVFAYFALALPRVSTYARRHLGVATPSRTEGLAFLSMIGVVVLLAVLMPSWEGERDELIETILYALMLAIGIRIAIAPRHARIDSGS